MASSRQRQKQRRAAHRAEMREERLWNNPNPITPIEKARAVVKDIVDAVHNVSLPTYIQRLCIRHSI